MTTRWTAVVTLDSVDVSSKISGTVIVEAEESTSRIAMFVLQSGAGTISAGDWLGKSVTIDYKTLNSSGGTISQDRIFTGLVEHAVFNPNTKLVTFDCSDNLQGDFEAMTQAEIDAIMTNTRWSEAVFGEYEDGWLYFEDISKTYPQSYDYNVDGTTGTLVDWAAKVTADFSYTASDIFDGTIRYSLAPKRELFNQYTITYNYRFDRLKHRSHGFAWSGAAAFCEYFAQSFELPTRDMIAEAAAGAGWHVVQPIQYDSLPKSKASVCGGAGAWVISKEFQETLATGAAFSVTKKWTQTATENYVLTVSAPQSIAWLGTIAYEEQASNQTETNADGWAEDTTTPTGRTDSLGDIVQDKYDRTVSDNDIETLVARARTEILASHRENYVEAEIELNPTLERFHTVSLSANGVSGKGKVFKYVHSVDFDDGEAITEIKIAVSINGGEAASGDDTIEAPTAPDTDPDVTAPDASTTLPTRIGSDNSVDDFDEDWNGFTGNYSVPVGTPTPRQIYPRRFKVVTPDIDQEAIDHIEAEKTQAYEFDIPNETLTITVS